MYEQVKPIADVLLDMREDLKREFETRIEETGTLAFRVAFAVLRNREDAEDVAQERLQGRIGGSGSFEIAIVSGPGLSG